MTRPRRHEPAPPTPLTVAELAAMAARLSGCADEIWAAGPPQGRHAMRCAAFLDAAAAALRQASAELDEGTASPS